MKIKKTGTKKAKNIRLGEVYSVKWVKLSFFDRLKMYAESVWDSIRFFPGKQHPHISLHKGCTSHN